MYYNMLSISSTENVGISYRTCAIETLLSISLCVTATVSLLCAENFLSLTLPCYALVRVLGTLHFLSSQVPLGRAGTVVGS